MTPTQVRAVYDDAYATLYDRRFLLDPANGFLEKTRFELTLLRALSQGARAWLDVACGTGFFLDRARPRPRPEALTVGGLDLSAAMLARARAANPDALLICADFREPRPEWEGRWDLCSCMWGAYALQQNEADVEALIRNLAAWTAPGGRCFVPVFEPALLVRHRANGTLMEGMSLNGDGTRWSWVEPDGRTHTDLVCPPRVAMEALFLQYFSALEIQPYPNAPDGVALLSFVATR